jgi:hypothetical protein
MKTISRTEWALIILTFANGLYIAGTLITGTVPVPRYAIYAVIIIVADIFAIYRHLTGKKI